MQRDAGASQTKRESRKAATADRQPAGTVSQAVGEALRIWRKEAGLSIREVAERSGLSVSFISLLERGRTEVALTRLIRLTDVFDRQISDIIGGANHDSPLQDTSEDGGDWRLRKVYGLADGATLVYVGEPEWTMQPFIMILQPGAVHGPVIHSYSEYVVCLDGEGTLVIDGKESPVSAGDFVTIQPDTYHAYMNCGSSTCRLLAIDSRSADDLRLLLDTYEQIGRSRRPSAHDGDAPTPAGDAPSERPRPRI